jgi:hypothetical protein
MDQVTIIQEGHDLYQNIFIDNILSENNILEHQDILNEKEKKFLEISCKEILIDAINENINYKNIKLKTIKKLKDMDYNKTIKYYLSLNEGEVIHINEAGIRDFESKTKKMLKYGLAAIVGGKIGGKTGVGISLILNYMYRKLTDPC